MAPTSLSVGDALATGGTAASRASPGPRHCCPEAALGRPGGRFDAPGRRSPSPYLPPPPRPRLCSLLFLSIALGLKQ